MPDTEKPEFTKQSLKGFMMRIMMMVDILRKKKGDQVFSMKHLWGLGVTTDKDTVLAPEEVIKAKEALSRIEKNLFYRLGRYLGSKLGSQPIK